MKLGRFKLGFLRQVLLVSLSSFGGPQAHLALFLEQLSNKRKYISEEELLELNALCQMLPGPTSTQTITSVGFKLGGPFLAFMTLMIWIAPATILMSLAAAIYVFFEKKSIDTQFLIYLQPLAIGFIGAAAVRLSNSVVKNKALLFILIGVSAISLFIRSPYLIPLVLLAGGLISRRFNKQFMLQRPIEFKIRMANFYLWLSILIVLAIAGAITQYPWVLLLENFYRYGSLVFGGGQVLIPMLFEQLVHFKGYLSEHDFFTGYGIAQAVPGPVFAFCSFLATVSLYKIYSSFWVFLLGPIIGAVGIFLPGTFFIFFVYPIWNQLKKLVIVRKSIDGVNAAACGLIISAALLFTKHLVETNPLSDDIIINLSIIGITILLQTKVKIPANFLVALAIGAGVIHQLSESAILTL